MKESTNIANRFSDAYIVAMLDGGDTSGDDVIRRYESSYPELGDIFRHNAKDLELLYGHIRRGEMPSGSVISRAYEHILARMGQAATIVPAPVVESFPSRLVKAVSSFFTLRPVAAGASLSLATAVLLAIMFYPRSEQKGPSELSTNSGNVPSSLQEPRPSDEVAHIEPRADDPVAPQPLFRGGDQEQVGGKDKALLDKTDRERLPSLLNKNTLAAPTGLKVVVYTTDSVVVQWNPVKNALSYIVEVKRANAEQFTAVSQTSQTQARLSDLPSSERVEIRVLAASGERKGEASAAKTVTVP
jgi:hypothetical protein